MRLYPHGGYLNPGYGAWGIGVTIQFVVALCLLLLAVGDREEQVSHSAETDRTDSIKYTSSSFYKAMDGLHIIGGAVTGALVAVGYLFLPIVLLPMGPITIANWCLILVTAGCCGSVVTEVQKQQKSALQDMRGSEVEARRAAGYTELWAYHHQVALVFISCMCVALIPCYFAGLVYSKDSTTGTRATAWFYVSNLALVSAVVVTLLKGLPSYRSIGIIWYILWALLILCFVLQQICWYRVFAIVIGVLFALAVVYGLIIWIVTAASYTRTKKYTIAWQQQQLKPDGVSKLTDSQYKWLKVTLLSNHGLYLLWECVLSGVLVVVAAFSMLYALYSVCTKKPPAAGSAKKETPAETKDADETAGLKEEEPAPPPAEADAGEVP